ncbi:MAG: hypothetical protein IJ787_05870 [Bacilli bacterium]|nr:hypothetical protein [Bacilli bacterium]
MLFTVQFMLFTYFVLAETPNPILPVALSVLGTVVLFVLVRLAMFLYRSQDSEVIIFARRIADLNAKVVRLQLTVENLKHQPKALRDLQIVAYEGKEYTCLAKLDIAPIQSSGSPNLIESSGETYGLYFASNSRNEVVVHFTLSEPRKSAYLLATNIKGQKVRAYLNLESNDAQILSFRKA